MNNQSKMDSDVFKNNYVELMSVVTNATTVIIV